MTNIKTINKVLSTLNFIMIFVGYPLITGLFLPDSSDIEGISRTVTVPYRAFALAISLLVLLLNYKNKIRQSSLGLKTFFFFWILLLIRIYYDTMIRTDLILGDTSRLWLTILFITLTGFLSVLKSYSFINFQLSLKWIFRSIIVIFILSLFSNQAMLVASSELVDRQNSNLAFNSISFGHLAATSIILGLYMLKQRNNTKISIVFIYLTILLSGFCMLRAGSRGPIVSLFAVLLFWKFSGYKKIKKSLLAVFSIVTLIYIFIEQILDFMGLISPIMMERMKLFVYEGNTSDRNPLYEQAISHFYHNPFWGEQFALTFSDGTYAYSHNIFLDALMGLGIIGGLLMAYFIYKALIRGYVFVKNEVPNYWIFLLFIQFFIANMLSGSIYDNPNLSVLLVITYLYDYKKVKRIKITTP